MTTTMELTAEPIETPKTSDCFVVLASGLGIYKRGDVVRTSDLSPGEINRFLAIKAVRIAYPAEAAQKHVELKDEFKDQSYNQMLADKDQQILSLRETIRELQEARAGQSPHQHATLESERVAHSALLREKDRVIMDLTERYKELTVKYQNLELRNRDSEQALHEAKQALAAQTPGSGPPPASVEEIQKRIQAAAGVVPPAAMMGVDSVETRKPKR